MRERWARDIAYLTGLLVLLLAAAFAWRLNAPNANSTATPVPTAETSPAAGGRDQIERGRILFDQLGCADCHALAGRGNPTIPLDTAAATGDDASIRAWIIAGASVENKLSPRVLERKKEYQALPPADLDALVEYLKHPGQSIE
jgi:mono/diheme cytochrome c family protein